jgi:predicted SAM-dependent methyltransferase
MKEKYVNLGCGQRYHPDWTNIDFVSSGAGVIAHNLSMGVPFPNTSCDVVYHSHLLEHFPKNSAESFLRECHRVLVPGGIIRIAVPDLESIAKSYLDALYRATDGEKDWAANHKWMLLEMYDQTVRNISGGAMAEYLMQQDVINEEFVFNRCGEEVRKLREIGRRRHTSALVSDTPSPSESLRKIKKTLARVKRIPMRVRELMLKYLLGAEYEALKIGRFRLSGEVHQWMYDRFSLRCLLASCGFVEIVQRNALKSYILNWSDYNLDTEPDGSIYKPDSIYMEGIKQ